MLGDLDRLQWKRVLVTGGTKGLGKAVVDRLTVMLVLRGTLQFQRAY